MPIQKLYKLTEQDWTTRKGYPNETKWGPGVEHSADPRYKGRGLCTAGFIHCYSHPLVAVFNNPKDAEIENPVLWEAEGEVIAGTANTKYGVYTLKTIRTLKLPTLSRNQRVAIAIYCSLKIANNSPKYTNWAKNWLTGKDRTAAVAYAHASTVYTAAAAHACTAATVAASAYAASYAAHAAAAASAYAAAASFDLLTIIRKVKKAGKKFH